MIILIKEELTENENENEKDEKDEKRTPLTIFIKISWSNCYGAIPCCLIVIFMFIQKSI